MAYEIVNFRKKNYVFKPLAVSIYILLITKFHNSTIDLLYKAEKTFIWKVIKTKIKYNPICNCYEKGGIKDVGWRNKTRSTQCSWVIRLFEDHFDD